MESPCQHILNDMEMTQLEVWPSLKNEAGGPIEGGNLDSGVLVHVRWVDDLDELLGFGTGIYHLLFLFYVVYIIKLWNTTHAKPGVSLYHIQYRICIHEILEYVTQKSIKTVQVYVKYLVKTRIITRHGIWYE
jgi:hypothetical protein